VSLSIVIIGLFLLLSIPMCWILPIRYRWLSLLIPSVILYALIADYQLIYLMAVWLITHWSAKRVAKGSLHVWWPIAILLLPLVISKLVENKGHFAVFQTNVIAGVNDASIFTSIPLLGASYITFVSIAYLVDVKRNYIVPEPSGARLLLFQSYFPTIMSGPIHRFKYLMPQLKQPELNQENVILGGRMLLWGLFKNTVVGRYLMYLLTILYGSDLGGGYFMLCGFIFFLFLYVNFSSFMDIFQGVSQIFGIRLRNNFRPRVYLSNSRQNFWSGWHIMLNEWFRDYVFYALAKKDKKRRHINKILFLTFVLIALWHELSLVLLLWGMLNGAWIILERKVLAKTTPPKILQSLGTLYHTAIASMIALVFISPSLSDIFHRLFVLPSNLPSFDSMKEILLISMAGMFFIDRIEAQLKDVRFDEYLGSLSTGKRWILYFALFGAILAFSQGSTVENYYIQF